MQKRDLNNSKTIVNILKKMYPDAKCELDHSSTFELLVATILSAQCTDVRVNIITKELYKKHNTPKDFAQLTYEELEGMIKSCGVYRNKAKSIINTSRILLDKYAGAVPENYEELINLPGVGRKTANVVLSNAFGVDAIAVDTHVFRVSNRLGLADAKNVLETEKQLMNNIDKDMWIRTHHNLIFHGRQICIARKPKCDQCELLPLCKYYQEKRIS